MAYIDLVKAYGSEQRGAVDVWCGGKVAESSRKLLQGE